MCGLRDRAIVVREHGAPAETTAKKARGESLALREAAARRAAQPHRLQTQRDAMIVQHGRVAVQMDGRRVDLVLPPR